MTSPVTTEYRRKIVQSNNRDFIVKYEDTKKAPHYGADQKFFNPWRGGLWQLPSLFSLAPFVWNTNKVRRFDIFVCLYVFLASTVVQFRKVFVANFFLLIDNRPSRELIR